jgi:carbon monoxide dehydrogenase subunit G
MKISGVATMHAPAGRVWDALNDPAVLVSTIPGCERLEATGPDSYRMTVTAGVASVRGTYSGEIALSERHEPDSFLMVASGSGGPGTVSTNVRVTLSATTEGFTELSYDADAVIGGMLAGVGQRMLASVAKRMAGEFFAAVDDVLAGKAVVPAMQAAPATAGQAPGAGQQATAFVAQARAGSAPRGADFGRGVLVGAAVALAGVLIGGLLGRRAR